MQQKIISFPPVLESAISKLLAEQTATGWLERAADLHQRYFIRERDMHHRYISDMTDALAYLALRAPATYAQNYGAMAATAEVLPHWQPHSLLDLGSGPGISVWAAQALWPHLTKSVCIDQDRNLLQLGETILRSANFDWNVLWQHEELAEIETSVNTTFDLVILSNVLNELSPSQADKVLGQAWNLCSGVLLIVEPGTPFGSSIVSSIAKKLGKTGRLLAPYVGNQLVVDNDYYLHFPQRFIRPEFTRRVRQRMRDDSLVASDWEEAKYSYVAIGKMEAETIAVGRCVGQVKHYNGYLEVPILTKTNIELFKVLKREKAQYVKMKKLQWGELILA